MTIPSSQIVSVTPSVLAAGGTGVLNIGLVLTRNPRVPIGAVLSFPNAAAVLAYFGPGNEANIATVYFTGPLNAGQIPSAILFAQYAGGGASAFLRGGNISQMALAALQGISGSLNITVDGYPLTTSINLSAATSFSNAASIIQTDLNSSLPTEASVTGSIAAQTFSVTGSIAGSVLNVTAVGSGLVEPGSAITGPGVAANTVVESQLSGVPGGIGTYAVNIAQQIPSSTITGSYGLMTVTAVGSGTLAVGETVTGAGVTSGTIITALGTGTGGTGTYVVNLTQTVGSETLTCTATPVVVTFDSQSGGFDIASGVTGAASSITFATGSAAAALLLTQATGAVISQGVAPQSPSTALNSLLAVNTNWVAFMTGFDPDGGNQSNVQKQAFAAWKNSQNNRFCYVCFDTDPTPAASVPASSSLGQILQTDGDSGTFLAWEPSDQKLAAFVLGFIAAINFNQINGRATAAFKTQPGLVPGVTDATTADNLAGNPQSSPGVFGNGYNFYGAYATAGLNNTWLQRGTVTGPFQWLDSYIDQIVMNSQMQNALLTLFANQKSVPFTQAGASLIIAALTPVIQQFLSFGAFGPGTLTAIQAQLILAATGNSNAPNTIATQGWYLQVVAASPAVQASRGPWQVNFFYLDNGAVQSIALSSVEVQA